MTFLQTVGRSRVVYKIGASEGNRTPVSALQEPHNAIIRRWRSKNKNGSRKKNRTFLASAYETGEFTRTLFCNKLVAPGGFEPPRTTIFEIVASASFALIHGAVTMLTIYHTTLILSTEISKNRKLVAVKGFEPPRTRRFK